jgi:hypothetical protein
MTRTSEESWPGGFCPSCIDEVRRERRAKIGAKLIAKGKDGGIDERGYQVIVLPEKRRRR